MNHGSEAVTAEDRSKGEERQEDEFEDNAGRHEKRGDGLCSWRGGRRNRLQNVTDLTSDNRVSLGRRGVL